jgi:hypothetical protein
MTAAGRVRLSGLVWLLVTSVVGTASAAPVPISRAVDWVATGVEVVGIAIIVLGAMLATAVFLHRWRQGKPGQNLVYISGELSRLVR